MRCVQLRSEPALARHDLPAVTSGMATGMERQDADVELGRCPVPRLRSPVEGSVGSKTESALRNVGQIGRAPWESAQAALPVHLSGTVLVLSGLESSFFFAD